MTREEAINILNDYDINFERNTPEEISEAHEMAIEALEQKSCEDCCNGNQEEKAKLCQKSYIAGMEHNCENEQIIRIKKGTLKARTGKYVVYDAEWLKEHFNTTEAKIYGQSKPSERTEERTETHECDYISEMTREERENALHCLKVMIDEEVCEECNLYGTTGTDHCEADCVRAAIKALQEYQHYKDLAESYEKTINKLTKAIAEQQPKEEPQQKTGHWEWVQYESKPNFGNWHCSECSCILHGEINGNSIRLPKYCPECGSYNGGKKE